MSDPREPNGSSWNFYDLVFKITYHFLHTLLDRQSQRCTQIKGRETDTQWKTCQSHIARRAYGIDDVVAAMFATMRKTVKVSSACVKSAKLRIRLETFYL